MFKMHCKNGMEDNAVRRDFLVHFWGPLSVQFANKNIGKGPPSSILSELLKQMKGTNLLLYF